MSTRKRRTVTKHVQTEDEVRVSVSERDGVLVALEPQLFRPGREAFCRRLANAVGRQKDVRSVQACLTSGSCRIEFAAGQVGAAEMAGRFAEAVRAAISEGAVDGKPAGDRGWATLTVFPADGAVSCWETTRQGRGDLRLRNPILRKDQALTRRVARELSGAPGVASCRATFWGRDLEIRFDPDVTSSDLVVSAAEDAFRRILRPALDRSTVEEPGPPAVVTGLRRVWYLALAGGSFTLTVVGLIVPGVPTVPFLLATSYYLARSSSRLNGMLLRSRFFGPILADLEKWGGLRRINKIKLIGLTLTVGVVTLILIGPSLALVLVMSAVASASIYAITRLPGIPSRSELAPPPRLALAGPIA